MTLLKLIRPVKNMLRRGCKQLKSKSSRFTIKYIIEQRKLNKIKKGSSPKEELPLRSIIRNY